MTTTPNPITPPAELVQEWADMIATHTDAEVFTAAAQWGANMELEACLDWLDRRGSIVIQDELRAARRPKPQNLKEQAFLALEALLGPTKGGANAETIRRALEQLSDD